ncbi:hypothetical protein [Hungatella sp.]|uniref:hypothetical protein n=1 Tax=Hungatella sp. TaxID=2613924 RepID=UPI00399321C6
MTQRQREGYREKPENMTHLRGNLLVMKTHPRIVFRGKVDTIQAKVLLLMEEYRNEAGFYKDLADILNGLREVLGSEVKGRGNQRILSLRSG